MIAVCIQDYMKGELIIIEKRFQGMRDKMLRRQQHELNIFLANQWHQLAVSDKEMSLNKLIADGWVARFSQENNINGGAPENSLYLYNSIQLTFPYELKAERSIESI